MKATVIANSNIAFIKYWGKKDVEQNIPMNQSISMTLDGISTKTTVEFSERFLHDVFILNNQIQTGRKLERVINFINLVRKDNTNAKIVSFNNFPTGAGIASSASGFAALAASLNKALDLEMSDRNLSSLARQGSGSATRSIFGGFVEWQGETAEQLFPEGHWAEIRDLIVILSEEEKKISSRKGMNLTVKKSKHYKTRQKHLPKRIHEVKNAIKKKNFERLAEIIMKDSDDMHKCIEEAGINYLNEKSGEVKKLIKEINKKKIICGYSFDAGPNPHIITLEKHVKEIKKELNKISSKLLIARPGAGVKYTEEHLF